MLCGVIAMADEQVRRKWHAANEEGEQEGQHNAGKLKEIADSLVHPVGSRLQPFHDLLVIDGE